MDQSVIQPEKSKLPFSRGFRNHTYELMFDRLILLIVFINAVELVVVTHVVDAITFWAQVTLNI